MQVVGVVNACTVVPDELKLSGANTVDTACPKLVPVTLTGELPMVSTRRGKDCKVSPNDVAD